MAGYFFYFLLLCSCGLSFCLELKQVLILSRHNVRTPLAERLTTMSPKTWKKWNQPPGEMTEKGAILEGYIGEYFAEWMKSQGLYQYLDEDSIHVYANTRQRTIDTATAFIDAFRNCNVTVLSKNTKEMDPIFNPVIHNSTEVFKEQVYTEINKNLNESDLNDVLEELNGILNIKDSQICKEQSFCDLVNDKNSIVYEVGEEPNLNGPMNIANAVVDSFLMSYYEGLPLKDIAWGEIHSEDKLEYLTKVLRDSLKVRFSLPKSSKDISKPLVQYMKDILSSNKTFIVLVGHDSNLNSVFSALEFKSFNLPDRFEITPIGAKLVFQRWSDGTKDFLKMEYVYETYSQIRNAERLNLLNPPKNITMFFKDLEDDNGFYPWCDFEKILQEVTK